MAVDQTSMRRDLFDLIKVFGPANAGGPAQMNTNPGANPNPPANVAQGRAEDPAPGPQAAAVTQNGGISVTPSAPMQAPSPVGVRQLPPNTPVKPNSGDYVVPGSAAVNQQPIELLPSDADPNLLSPEMRNSPLFRYLQAQRVAQYRDAQERSRFSNFAGALGNIASLATGGEAINQGGARAGTPSPLGFQELHTLQDDALKAAASQRKDAEMAQLTEDLIKGGGMSREQARAVVLSKAEKGADIIADKVSINDSEKNRQRINVERTIKGQPEIGPEQWHRMTGDEQIRVAAGSMDKGFMEAQVKRTDTAITAADLARDAVQPSLSSFRALQAGKGWTGAISGRPSFQQGMQIVADLFGKGSIEGVTDSQSMKIAAYNALLAQASKLGTQPSDADRAVIEKLVGADGSFNREALIELHRSQLRMHVQAQINAQQQIAAARKMSAGSGGAGSQYLDAAEERIRQNLPDLTNEIFDPKDVTGLTTYLTSSASEADKAGVMKSFDKQFGAGKAAYVLQMKGIPYGGQ